MIAMKLVDLSIPIYHNMPIYPGDPPTIVKPAGIMERDGYEDYYVSLGTHAGTHIDAPRHMITNGKGLDEIDLNAFTGRGVYIEILNKTFSLTAVKQIAIQEGDIVLFHTGMAKTLGTPEYLSDFPHITKEIAEYLIAKKVKMVGMDMVAPDIKPFPIHKLLLKQNILIIENLTNLHLLKGKQFNVLAFPIRLQAEAAPARVIAEIQ